MIRNCVDFFGLKNGKFFTGNELNFFIFLGDSKIVSSQLIRCGLQGAIVYVDLKYPSMDIAHLKRSS